jgi:hypothetical protein
VTIAMRIGSFTALIICRPGRHRGVPRPEHDLG